MKPRSLLSPGGCGTLLLFDAFLPSRVKCGPHALDVKLGASPALVLIGGPLALDLALTADHAGGLLGTVLHVGHGGAAGQAARASGRSPSRGEQRADWVLESLGEKCIGDSGNGRLRRLQAGIKVFLPVALRSGGTGNGMDAGAKGSRSFGKRRRRMSGRWARGGEHAGDPGFQQI